ncbi:class I SAM-dependent methyltransferase [Actinoalloteichus hymeniacidonis]|uniref:Methyltransferase domain n=1 Tax=Actinoalloteichus hymeniacidonis TaxID=340345 RepID=A0AAC9HSJ8_9PSEU|nr:class I SAM-dependent methyltransferase [Actinoalloteichus hymeniacidonis]AOS63695.1 Methyltransferase domain [Actinoalloteichus hymeniacidonis]MBB5908252.1 SAM-dependent methyltransferase [Actinoalloteichus hymeniacidonis]
MVADYYTTSAEFYEMVAMRHVRTSAGPLKTALSGVRPAHGPVVEVGAGTGRITAVIAEALPTASIIATEPSTPMRAMLTSRVFGDADLRSRVTVLADPVQLLRLPDSISAVVIFGVVGHLTETERRLMWRRLSERLPTGAPIIVELMGTGTPRVVPPFRMLRETMGEQTYEWWTEAEPLRDDVMRWRTSWKIFRDGDLVRSTHDEYDWENLSLDRLAAEAGMNSRLISAAGVPGSPEIGMLIR